MPGIGVGVGVGTAVALGIGLGVGLGTGAGSGLGAGSASSASSAASATNPVPNLPPAAFLMAKGRMRPWAWSWHGLFLAKIWGSYGMFVDMCCCF